MATTKAIPECYFRGPDGCVILQTSCTYPPAVNFCAAAPVPTHSDIALALMVLAVLLIAAGAAGAHPQRHRARPDGAGGAADRRRCDSEEAMRTVYDRDVDLTDAGLVRAPFRVRSELRSSPQPGKPFTAPVACTSACYWRVEIMLHGGQTITRDVATAPNVRELLLAGWYEVAPNGDTFAIAYDAIATISVRKLQGVPPSGIVGSLQ